MGSSASVSFRKGGVWIPDDVLKEYVRASDGSLLTLLSGRPASRVDERPSLAHAPEPGGGAATGKPLHPPSGGVSTTDEAKGSDSEGSAALGTAGASTDTSTLPTFVVDGDKCDAHKFVDLVRLTWARQRQVCGLMPAVVRPASGPTGGLPLYVSESAADGTTATEDLQIDNALLQHVGRIGDKFVANAWKSAMTPESDRRRIHAVVQASGGGKTHMTTYLLGRRKFLACPVQFWLGTEPMPAFNAVLKELGKLVPTAVRGRLDVEGDTTETEIAAARRALDLLRCHTMAHVEWTLDVVDELKKTGVKMTADPDNVAQYQDATLRAHRNGHGKSACLAYVRRVLAATDNADHGKVESRLAEVVERTRIVTKALGLATLHVAFDEVHALFDTVPIFFSRAAYRGVRGAPKNRDAFVGLLLHAEQLVNDGWSASVCGTHFTIGDVLTDLARDSSVSPIRKVANVVHNLDAATEDNMCTSLSQYLCIDAHEIDETTRRALRLYCGRPFFFYFLFYNALWSAICAKMRVDVSSSAAASDGADSHAAAAGAGAAAAAGISSGDGSGHGAADNVRQVNALITTAAEAAWAECVEHAKDTLLSPHWAAPGMAVAQPIYHRQTAIKDGFDVRQAMRELFQAVRLTNGRARAYTGLPLAQLLTRSVLFAPNVDELYDVDVTSEPAVAAALDELGAMHVLAAAESGPSDFVFESLSTFMKKATASGRGDTGEYVLAWFVQRQCILTVHRTVAAKAQNLRRDPLLASEALYSLLPRGFEWPRLLKNVYLTIEGSVQHASGDGDCQAHLERHGATRVLTNLDNAMGTDVMIPLANIDGRMCGSINVQCKVRKRYSFGEALASVSLEHQFRVRNPDTKARALNMVKPTKKTPGMSNMKVLADAVRAHNLSVLLEKGAPNGPGPHGDFVAAQAKSAIKPAFDLWVMALFSAKPFDTEVVAAVNKFNDENDDKYSPILLLQSSRAAFGSACHNALVAEIGSRSMLPQVDAQALFAGLSQVRPTS